MIYSYNISGTIVYEIDVDGYVDSTSVLLLQETVNCHKTGIPFEQLISEE